jgi:putative chitinase
MVTAEQLKRIMPQVGPRQMGYLEPLNEALSEFEINTPERQSAFLAQIAHESGQLRWMEEIWGPTSAQRRYEGRKDLGNTQPGDGKRFKGRGPIQITGRENYRKYGVLLNVELLKNPGLAATPKVAFRIAGAYWKTHGLNELADKGDFIEITKRINGGLNGLQDRQEFYERAKTVLA